MVTGVTAFSFVGSVDKLVFDKLKISHFSQVVGTNMPSLQVDLAVFESLICKLHQLCGYYSWMMGDIESHITPPINRSQLFSAVDSIATSRQTTNH